MYDNRTHPSHIQPWLRILFSGSAYPLPAMPPGLADLIAAYALPPPEARPPLLGTVFTVVRARAGRTSSDNVCDVEVFRSPEAVRACLLRPAEELEREGEEGGWDEEKQEEIAPPPPLDGLDWRQLKDLLNEHNPPDSVWSVVTTVHVEEIRDTR